MCQFTSCMCVTTRTFPDPSVFCLCECSWRATWPQVSERLCRGSCWRWRVCTARFAPATLLSKPWSVGSADCSDSPRAEAKNTKTQRLAKTEILFMLNENLCQATPLNSAISHSQLSVCLLFPLEYCGVETQGAFCVTNPNYVWLTPREENSSKKWEKERKCTTHIIFLHVWNSVCWFLFCENKRFLYLLNT